MAKKKYNSNYQAYNAGIESVDEENTEVATEEIAETEEVAVEETKEEVPVIKAEPVEEYVKVAESDKAVISPTEVKKEEIKKEEEGIKNSTTLSTGIDNIKPIITPGRKVTLYKAPLYRDAVSDNIISRGLSGTFFVVGVGKNRVRISRTTNTSDTIGYIDINVLM